MNSDATENIVILAEDVTKRFRLRGGGTPTLKSAALDLVRSRRRGREDFFALRNVNFAVSGGETLGIIGANGAGKSTLLSLLAGTMRPSGGRIETKGAISSLLELGAGFHPDLTGRENIYLYGAIMGLPRRRMKERFDAIVDFAELERFIDQPVKHYSSGMCVRLGFAVAVEVDPDILLIDEVLAVGDASFQRKCLERIRQFRAARKTMLIVSHDLPTIQSISDRILLLDGGEIRGLGDPRGVVGTYQGMSRRKSAQGLGREWGTGEVRITEVKTYNLSGAESDAFGWRDGLEARISYEARTRVENPVFGFSISNTRGCVVYGNNTQIEGFPVSFAEGKGELILRIRQLNLARGEYLMSFSVHSSDHTANYHRLDNHLPIAIECDKSFEGCYMECEWLRSEEGRR